MSEKEERAKELQTDLAIGNQVREMVSSEGWKKIIEKINKARKLLIDELISLDPEEVMRDPLHAVTLIIRIQKNDKPVKMVEEIVEDGDQAEAELNPR